MVRGQYIAGTGMLLQRRMMENITNNITNVETVGFKKNYLVSHSFDDVLLRRINDTAAPNATRYPGPLNFGTQVDQLYTNFEQGYFEETEMNTDLAIVGDAFFVLETNDGERYSKSGAFVVNSEGYLTDGEGHYLMGTNGHVFVGNGGFLIDDQGNVYVDGETSNTLMLVSFTDLNLLRREGSNLFDPNGAAANPAENFAVKQGFVENSNVDVAREMVDMMTTYRAYETNQRILTMIDETVGKAVNDIGRLR